LDDKVLPTKLALKSFGRGLFASHEFGTYDRGILNHLAGAHTDPVSQHSAPHQRPFTDNHIVP
jgi:hypothetical protein